MHDLETIIGRNVDRVMSKAREYFREQTGRLPDLIENLEILEFVRRGGSYIDVVDGIVFSLLDIGDAPAIEDIEGFSSAA